MSIAEILQHPLSLLLIGALLSGVLIPYFTNRWQNHQKELEIKINLVQRISQTIMRMMTMIESTQDRIVKVAEGRRNLSGTITEDSVASIEEKVKKSFGELDKEYRNFKIDSTSIGTELKSYFLTEKIVGEEWDKLMKDIECFYTRIEKDFKEARSGALDEEKRRAIEAKGQEILDKKHSVILLVLEKPMDRFSPRSITGWIKSKVDARKK